jgi:16S rRNA (guanine1516-N2)-methyltransferase
VVTPERLELRSSQTAGSSAVYVDFVHGALGYSRRVGGSRLLFRAIGSVARAPNVIDATAGLGRDAFLLACKGHTVTAIERSPIIAALLQDGIKRALSDSDLREFLHARLRLVQADARVFLKDLPVEQAPDVVYLDPMFPPRTKSAMVKKEAIVLRAVVGGDEDAAELLEAARAVARRHVVVKRMRHAPPIAPGVARTYEGKTTRYDVYNSFLYPSHSQEVVSILGP